MDAVELNKVGTGQMDTQVELYVLSVADINEFAHNFKHSSVDLEGI